jgi:Leucine-rich repeat (LRR) protein
MKNAIITLLTLEVATLGIILYISNEAPSNRSSVSTDRSNSGSTQEQTSKNRGKVIDLSGKNLEKVSQDILDDSSVTTLDVSVNNLTGSLPGEIRKLTNLEILNVSNNKMTGIPAEIGQLSRLVTANFSFNNLSGLPNDVGNLKNLETLDLRGNPNISKNDIALIQKEIPNTKIIVD